MLMGARRRDTGLADCRRPSGVAIGSRPPSSLGGSVTRGLLDDRPERERKYHRHEWAGPDRRHVGFITAGPDSVFGGDGNDTILGGNSGSGIPASDFLIGDAGDDQLFGEGGDDALFGCVGNDSMDGGAATDLMFGEDGNDRVVGGTGLDALLGGAGADIFVLTPEPGNPNIEGIFDFNRAEGDRIEFSAAAFAGVATAAQAVAGQTTISGGVLVNGQIVPTLYTAINLGTASAPQFLLVGGNPALIAGDFVVTGVGTSPPPPPTATMATAGADNLTGTSGADLLDGLAGNDTLSGLAGNDTLIGGDGNDRLLPGAGADLADGGAGDDVIEGTPDSPDDILLGGAGDDTISLVDPGSALSASNSDRIETDVAVATDVILNPILSVDLSNGLGAPGGFFDSQSTVDFESDVTLNPDDHRKIQTISAAITAIGSSENQIARGNGRINGFENLSGLSDTDISIFAPQLARSFIDISGFRSGVVVGFVGSDTIFGSNGSDILAGGPGNDSIRGNGGMDLIRGGAGADLIDGGAGNDSTDGGAGTDIYRIDFSSSTAGSLINAAAGATINGGQGDVDTIVGIERFDITGGSGNDTLIGGAGFDILIGGLGNDFLAGGPGNFDFLQGGAGADRFVLGGLGDSALDGGGFGVDFINDFNQPEGDRFAGPGTTGIARLFNAGSVSGANLGAAVAAAYGDRDQATAGAQALAANQAVFFIFNGRVYLAINDDSAAFNQGGDAVLDVTGIVAKVGDAVLGTLIAGDYLL